MALKQFRIYPWQQGLNTNLDPSLIPPGALVQADHIEMGVRSSKKKRPGIDHNWDDVTTGSTNVVKLHDFWYGTSSKTQKLVSVINDVTAANKTYKSYSLADGTSTALTDAGTAWTGTISNVTSETYNNLCIMAANGSGNVLKKWSGSGDVDDLDGTPPVASVLRAFQGRLFTNDKTNKDRLHFSPVHDHTQWNGTGDSGAFDIGVGDGDPDGITAIFPPFRGDLFVAKRTKIYRIQTYQSNDPTLWSITLVSDGVGCVSHNSCVAIEQDDIVFASERGIHSLVAVQKYGDFESTFLSANIQKTYNEDIDRSRLEYIQAAYDSTTNTIAFTFTQNNVSSINSENSKLLYGSSAGVTSSMNNAVYLYNIVFKEWYRWPGTSCQSIISVRDPADNKIRFFLGTHITRVSRTKTANLYDVSQDNNNVAVVPVIKTGLMYPEQDPYLQIALKQLIIYYKPEGTHTHIVNVTVDNQSLDTESNSQGFSATTSVAILGSSFTLGQSVLGYTSNLSAYRRGISGVGRGIQLEITNSGENEEMEIQGFGFEYEPISAAGEVII